MPQQRTYKELPPNSKYISLKWNGCDTTCCGMGHYEIWARDENNKGILLFETRTICYEEIGEQEDCIDELRTAFDYYDISDDKLIIDNFWDLDEELYWLNNE